MDSFPRPDVGYGIFFEYMRLDDPFSPDFIERAVDGFPHLLSPLAQVEGIMASVMQQTPAKSTESTGKSVFKAFSHAAEQISSQAAGLAGAVQSTAAGAAANAVQVAQTAGDAMKILGEEAELKRQDMWKQMV